MSLTRTQVEGIAHLARLEITEAQMPVYVDSLSRIIDFVEQLSAA
jgi:aspartyl-tRNA(Asn)/glutamyl-tRNA(Gln) amidotransferase subunit C